MSSWPTVLPRGKKETNGLSETFDANEDPDPAPPPVDMQKLGKKATLDRIAEIKSLIRSLTYGEMMEVVTGFWGQKPPAEEMAVGSADLPGMFHRWATDD